MKFSTAFLFAATQLLVAVNGAALKSSPGEIAPGTAPEVNGIEYEREGPEGASILEKRQSCPTDQWWCSLASRCCPRKPRWGNGPAWCCQSGCCSWSATNTSKCYGTPGSCS